MQCCEPEFSCGHHGWTAHKKQSGKDHYYNTPTSIRGC